MKIHILSDLHLNHYDYRRPIPFETESDLAIVAGDISTSSMAIEECQKILPNANKIVFVPGNHEYYAKWDALYSDTKMGIDAEKTSKVVFLQNKTLILGHLRIIGTTLWTDFNLYKTANESASYAYVGMADYRCIPYFSPKLSQSLFYQAKFFIEKELSTPFDGTTVVVTHHLPSIKSVHPDYMGSPLNPAFASSLDELVRKADYWIHGHTHTSCDYKIGKCHVLCNPRGYPRDYDRTFENPGFNPELLIEVP